MGYTILLQFRYRPLQTVAVHGGLEAAIAIATDYLRTHKASEVQVIDSTDTVVFSRASKTSDV